MKTSVDVFHPCSATLGEGVGWHPSRQTLWWIDITERRLYESTPDGRSVHITVLHQMVGAIAPTRSGALVAALEDGIYLIDPDSGAAKPFALPTNHDRQKFRFNDAKVDPAGRFWAGTTSVTDVQGQSKLYRVGPDGAIDVMLERVSISNGIAWSPDQRTMYYIDSPTRVVQAFPYDLKTGEIGKPRVAISLPPGEDLPDGCTMDVEGRLWVAHWGASKVTCWDPVAGKLVLTLSLPTPNVTSCAFGGPSLDRLFITTAANDNDRSDDLAGHVFVADVKTRGPEPFVFG